MLLSGPSLLQLKNGQLGPDNSTSNLRAPFFKTKCWNPYFCSAFWQTMFCNKANLAQIITPQHIYIYIYTYIYCRVKNLSKNFVCLLFPNFIVLWESKKNTNSVYGCENNFFVGYRGVKKGVSKKNVHFLFLSFFMLDKANEKRWKMEKENFIKSPEKQCFLGGCEEKRSFLLEWHFFEK